MAKARSKKIAIEDALVPVEEQPYEVPENWCWVRLGTLCSFIGGGTPDKSITNYWNGNIPWASVKDIKGDILVSTIDSITEEGLNNSATNICKAGELIVVTRIEPGKTIVSQIDTAINQDLKIVRSRINVNYLHYFFSFSRHLIEEKASGTTVKGIKINDLEMTNFPLPPIPEQQRIVEQIERLFIKLDEAKEMAQYALDSIAVRKESILLKALDGYLTETWRMKTGIKKDSWKVKKIEDLSDVKGGKRVPKGMSLVSEDTGHPYIKAGNLKKGTVIDEGIQYVPADVLEYIKNYTVKAGDVYITNVGACIGDCGVIPEKYDGANLTENAVKMTNLRECESKFLAYYLASNHVQQIIKGLIASATLGKLSIANIKGIEINLPLMEEQREIIRIIEDIFDAEENVANTIEKVLDDIELMKKSILAKAFRGELGTNNPMEESSMELLKQILK